MAFNVTNPATVTDAGALELDGADSIATATVGNATYMFVAGGVDDGVSVFRVNADGTLTSTANVTDAGALELDGATGLSTAMIDGNTYLFVAGKVDNGVSVFRVGLGGTLTNTQNVDDTASTALAGISDTATARVGGNTFLFTAGTFDDSVGVFQVGGDGRLTALASVVDTATLNLFRVSALSTATVGATSYLIAAGGSDNGLSVFSISAAGALTNVSNVSDNATLNLANLRDVTTAVVGGVTYVIAAGATDNGVSVFSLSAAGVLTSVANVTDSATTLIAGAQSLSTAVIGSSTYLTVGGTESGMSLFRIETGGTLTFLSNIADTAGTALATTTTTGSVSVNGTTYLVGAGLTEDGVSTFGTHPSGQLYFFGQGNPTDARLSYLNNDGSNQTVIVDNNPTVDLSTSVPQKIGVDTAAGFYFAIVNGGADGSNAQLVRGTLGGAPDTVLATFFGTDNAGGTSDDTIVNALQIDTVNHYIYIGVQAADGASPGTTGIQRYTYNPTTGAVGTGTYITTVSSSGLATESGLSILDPRDFALDPTTNTLIFTESLSGTGVNGVYRLNLANPGAAGAVTQIVAQTTFPDDGSNGFVVDVEVDKSNGKVYFDTQSADNSTGYVAAQNKIYWIAESANGGVPTALTLVGLPATNHYFGSMTFDQTTRQLYVTSDESDNGNGPSDDVIYVLQLDAAGTTGTLINTVSAIPAFTEDSANFGGMAFNALPTLSLTGATPTAIEQGATVVLLTANPTIADTDGDHLASATVQVTGGTFASNESSTADDHLGYGAAQQISGTIAGTNITLSWNAATETLTLTGYDTLANYQAALGAIRYWTTGDNPTNFDLNTARTVTFTVSDGSLNVPGGSQNSGSVTVNLSAVNDGPANIVPATQVTPEDTGKVLSGLQITDPDANPALATMSVTLSVLHGTLTFATAVNGGLVAGEISGNGTASVTLTATLNEINATLANAAGLTYLNTADYNGGDTVTVVTGDGGSTGSGGTLGATSSFAITVTPVVDITNDTINLTEDAGPTTLTAALLANDSFENPGRMITAVGTASHGIVTLNFSNDVIYYPYADYNGADSFTYTVTSGGVTETTIVNVNLSAVADIVPDNIIVNEDGGSYGLNLLGNDTFENSVRAITSVSTPLHGNATINDNGTPANATDDYVVYTPTANYNGADSFTYTVTSGGVTETATVSVTVNSVNDAPVLDLNGATAGTSATLAYTENGAATAIAPAGTVTDIDSPDFSGGSLRVGFTANGTTADQLTIQNQGTTAGLIGISGSNVTYGGTVIGTFSGGTNGTDLVVSFTSAAATLAAVQALEQHILYANSSDNPSTLARTVTFTANDGDGTANGGVATGSATATINVTAVDDPPVAVADIASLFENATTTIAVLGNDTDVDGGPAITIATVNGATLTAGQTTTLSSGAIVTLNANGTLGYDPNHKFDYLVSAATAASTGASDSSATDTFAYTINGGSATTVTVTVNGVDGAGDQIRGGGGNDTITGNPTQSNYIDLSQGGNDTATGGSANDGFYMGAAFNGADHIDGGAGTNDQIGLKGDYTGGNALVLQAGTITGIEAIVALGGFDYNITTVDANLAAGQNLVINGSQLGVGDDLTFNGSAETNGTFTVFGGLGADNITTGGGNDGIYFGAGRFNPATDHVDGGAGTNDQMALDGTYTGLTIARANVVNVEMLVLLDGQPAPVDYSITLADDWTTGAEVHSVYAVAVRHGVTVDGHLETTSMLRFFGGQGNDTLIGGSAGNLFDGGGGSDTMTGGAGVDTYNYSLANNSMGVNYDKIVNFNPGQDKIDLPFAVTGVDIAKTGALSTASFETDLASALATLGANHAVQFTATSGSLNGHVFEVIDANGVAGYQAGQDMVIELVTPTTAITTPAPFV